jgi:hypothetical protein
MSLPDPPLANLAVLLEDWLKEHTALSILDEIEQRARSLEIHKQDALRRNDMDEYLDINCAQVMIVNAVRTYRTMVREREAINGPGHSA